MQNFNADSFKIFDREWALLTAGNQGHYNTMTISWGGLGTLWGKPVVTVLDTAAMPADVVSAFYKNEAAHTMYIGEVCRIEGTNL